MTYIISYLRERADGGEDLTYADFVYVSTGRSLVAGAAGVMGGILANKIGLRPTLSLGAALYRHKCRSNHEFLAIIMKLSSPTNMWKQLIFQWRICSHLLCTQN